MNAIKPVVGNTKSDGILGHIHLAGTSGNTTDFILAATGNNISLLLRWLRDLLLFLRACVLMAKSPEASTRIALQLKSIGPNVRFALAAHAFRR
jgi:hypothetical protein